MVLLLVSTLPPLAAFAYCTAMLLRKGDRKKWLRLCVVTAVILVTISTFYLSYGSPDKPRGLSIQPCKSEKEEPYIRHSSQGRSECLYLRIE